MSAPGSHDLENILRRATQLGPRDSLDYLKSACGDDGDLYKEACQRLAASWPSDWYEMDPELAEYGPAPEACSRPAGEMIGPYRIIRALGSGGMGEVYLCERADDHYHQHVAIKLVNRGLMSKQVYNRLRTERQILASLDHPNIARLLDGGATADGVPYLVLEYIDGEPIDVYCNRLRLSVDRRLQLFRTVCSAVHAAHRSLVVHRDLKPSNILVTADGTLKLLDFGIAKLLDVRAASHTVALTQADIRVMTPDHAAPEQVRGGLITTASDVYVLGVLLYQLLCGKRAFEVRGLRLAEVERLICEEQPPAPSQRLRGIARENPVEIERIADERGTTPAKLVRQLAGELDTIVMMAMRKEPDRRYGSVEQLAADVELYQKDMPVIARKDTWPYRSRKFLGRHVFGVAASALVMLLLAGFAVSMYVQAERVRRERDLTAAQRTRAEVERNRAERVSEFLVDLFQRSDPSEARGADVTAREILERGAQRVDTELKQEPQTQAVLMDAMGRVYLGLGLSERAAPLLERSVELRRQLYGGQSPTTAAGMRSLAMARLDKGDLSGAEQLLRAALQIQSEAPARNADEIAATTQSLATVLLTRGDFEAAASLYREAISRLVALHGERHMAVTSALNELALVMLNRGDYAEAERLYSQALAIDRELLGNDHPQVLLQVASLATALQMQGKLAEAEPLFLESIATAERVLGAEHPNTIRARDNYGYFLQAKGENAAAERVAREVLALDQRVRGPGHYYVGYDMASLAGLLYDSGHLDEAETLYHKALTIYRTTLPQSHQYVAAALTGLARVFAERGDAAQVVEMTDRAIAIWRKELPEDHWQVANSRAVLGRSDMRSGKLAQAESILLANYALLEKQRGVNDLNTRRTRRWLAELYRAWNKPQLAGRYN